MAGKEEFDFEKLACEITVSQLKGIGHAPNVAAGIAGNMIVAGVASTRERQEPRLTVTGVCRGVLSGMRSIEGDLAATAVEILHSMAHLAQEVQQDPDDMRTWAMDAIVMVAASGQPDLKEKLRVALEADFMGAGDIFTALCAKAGAGPAAKT